MSSTHTSLDTAATERKARLAKLKSLKRKQVGDDEESTENTESKTAATDATPDPTRIFLSGRNYDADAKAAKLGFEHAPNADVSTLEIRAREIANEVEEVAIKEAETDKGIDLFKLQPKKPNWDLKRDLAKKMEILNVRTDNAIARIVRERIAAQQKAQKEKLDNNQTAPGDAEGAEVVGMKGEELVEGIHQREREEAEDEREDEDNDEA